MKPHVHKGRGVRRNRWTVWFQFIGVMVRLEFDTWDEAVAYALIVGRV